MYIVSNNEISPVLTLHIVNSNLSSSKAIFSRNILPPDPILSDRISTSSVKNRIQFNNDNVNA